MWDRHGGPGPTQDQAEGPGSASRPGHRSAAPAGHNGATSKAPDANAVPQPNCIPTPRPSWSPETGPQKAEITLDTGPEPEEHVYCPRQLILLRGLWHSRCQLSAGSRRRHVHRQEAPPPQASRSTPGPVRPGPVQSGGWGLRPLRRPPPPTCCSASTPWFPQVCRVRVGPDPHLLSVHPQ